MLKKTSLNTLILSSVVISLIAHFVLLFTFKLTSLKFISPNETKKPLSIAFVTPSKKKYKITKSALLKTHKIVQKRRTISKKAHSIESEDQFESLINHYVSPQYPPLAVRRGIQGSIIIELSLDLLGKVSAVNIIKPSGSKILDQEVIRTAYKWTFTNKKKIKIIKKIIYTLN